MFRGPNTLPSGLKTSFSALLVTIALRQCLQLREHRGQDLLAVLDEPGTFAAGEINQ